MRCCQRCGGSRIGISDRHGGGHTQHQHPLGHWQAAHLPEGALAAQKLVEHGDGDAEHGGKGQAPAQGLAPPGVYVAGVIGQGLVIHNMEQEDTLWTDTDMVSGTCSPLPVSRFMGKRAKILSQY